MTWFGWFLIGWWSLGAVLMIAIIGKPRDAMTPETAVVHLVISAAFIVALLAVGTGSL